MPIPPPEPGLVISYAYVWDREARRGQEEGRKDRPCVITLVVERHPGEETVVTVLPVTHRPPDDPAAAVEIPQPVKRYLGLDGERSWVIVSEGDRFVWPGYDLRKVPGGDPSTTASCRRASLPSSSRLSRPGTPAVARG